MAGSFPRIALIGGGAAPELLSRGLKGSTSMLAAIVCTTDTGSSTGVVRKLFGIPAPGDIRHAISVMSDPAESDPLLKELLEYRLNPSSVPSDLGGMALGNLIIAAASQRLGSFERAVEAVSSMMKVRGEVIPVTSEPAQLRAVLEDGTVVTGEAMVRSRGKPRIRDISVVPGVRTSERCKEALRRADLIVIGPGALYTSILPCLLVEGVSETIRSASAKRCLIANHTTTPGQTDRYTIMDHVREVLRYLGRDALDFVLISRGRPPEKMLKAYQAEGVHFIGVTDDQLEEIEALGITPVLGDFIEKRWKGIRKLHKTDTIRHDPEALVKALLELI